MINPFKKTFTVDEIKLFRFLGTIRHFNGLTDDELANFVPYLYLRDYKAREVVFFRDDPSHALYIVKKGVVALNFDIRDEFITLKTASRAQVFGDNSLIPSTKRIYTAVVETETAELYVVPQVNLFQIFSENPKIQAKMMANLSDLYNEYTVNLFKSYRSSFGFFDLRMVYMERGDDLTDLD